MLALAPCLASLFRTTGLTDDVWPPRAAHSRNPSAPLCRWSPSSSLTDIYSPSAAPLPMRRGGLTSLFGLAPSYISLAAKSE